MKLLQPKAKTTTSSFFTVQEVKRRAQQEMQRTGLSAEELLRQQADATTDWRVVPHTGLMEHWLAHRPTVRNTEPRVADASIRMLLTAGYNAAALADAVLFKGISQSEMSPDGNDTATSLLLRDRHQSPAGYYSTDICRALSFLNGRKRDVTVGIVGWLFVCADPWGQQPILDNSMLGDGRPAHNNDLRYAGANVIAFAQVEVTALRPR